MEPWSIGAASAGRRVPTALPHRGSAMACRYSTTTPPIPLKPRLAALLCPVAGSPDLRLLQGLRPPRRQPITSLSRQSRNDVKGFPRSRCSVRWGKYPAIPLQAARWRITAPPPPPTSADRARPTHQRRVPACLEPISTRFEPLSN